MAFEVSESGVITMFRGDTVALDVSLPVHGADGQATGHIYKMQEGDMLTLTVRELPSRSSPVLFSTTSTSSRILIVPLDTENLEPGEYSADIELRRADGSVETVFPLIENISAKARRKIVNWKNFVLIGEVTDV